MASHISKASQTDAYRNEELIEIERNEKILKCIKIMNLKYSDIELPKFFKHIGCFESVDNIYFRQIGDIFDCEGNLNEIGNNFLFAMKLRTFVALHAERYKVLYDFMKLDGKSAHLLRGIENDVKLMLSILLRLIRLTNNECEMETAEMKRLNLETNVNWIIITLSINLHVQTDKSPNIRMLLDRWESWSRDCHRILDYDSQPCATKFNKMLIIHMRDYYHQHKGLRGFSTDIDNAMSVRKNILDICNCYKYICAKLTPNKHASATKDKIEKQVFKLLENMLILFECTGDDCYAEQGNLEHYGITAHNCLLDFIIMTHKKVRLDFETFEDMCNSFGRVAKLVKLKDIYSQVEERRAELEKIKYLQDIYC